MQLKFNCICTLGHNHIILSVLQRPSISLALSNLYSVSDSVEEKGKIVKKNRQ